MIDTGCTLESLAMRSYEAATGTRTTMQACSISTTIGLTTTTTLSASADPTLQHQTMAMQPRKAQFWSRASRRKLQKQGNKPNRKPQQRLRVLLWDAAS